MPDPRVEDSKVSAEAADWPQVEALLDELLDLVPAKRQRRLAQGAEPESIKEQVRSLMIAAEYSARLLDTSPRAADAEAPAEPMPVEYASLAAGTELGRFRIVRLVGRGGMGEVYLATHSREDFEQRVAIKLVRPEAAARVHQFRTERRILARLQHPGIARLIDTGVAPDGRPFMAMDFVEGRDLLGWCAEHRSGLAQRLELFHQVCEAVAYAHRQLVIHRDLKPGNVWVTPDGQVRLLDFGIAKLLAPEADERTTGAAQTQAALTPEYAAPEQLEGRPLTLAADVYALGALLYELLAGRGPWEAASGTSLHRAMLRLVQEAPVLPSEAAVRNPQAPVAARALRGDLDAIVMKALRRDPLARYESASAVWADLERHRRALPVLARGVHAGYVLRRFARRHRWLAATAVLVLVTLALGVTGVLWQARQARLHAARAEAVKDFLLNVFEAANPDVAGAHEVTARELLDNGAARIDRQLGGQPLAAAEMKSAIGDAYFNLGEGAKARAQFVTALESLGARTDPWLRALTLGRLAELDRQAGRSDAARSAIDEALQLGAPFCREHPADYQRMRVTHAYLLEDDGDAAQALKIKREALDVLLQTVGPDADATLMTLNDVAMQLHREGRNPEALPLIRQIYERRLVTLGPEHPRTDYARHNLAYFLRRSGHPLEAVEMARANLEIRRRVLPAAHPDIAVSQNLLGNLLNNIGQYDEAERQLGEAVAAFAAQSDPSVRLLTNSLRSWGDIALQRGRLDDAQRRYARAEALQASRYGADSFGAVDARGDLARVEAERGHLDGAEQALRRVLEFLGKDTAPKAPDQIYPRIALARVLLYRGRAVEAQTLVEAALPVIDANFSGPDRTLAYAWKLEAEAQRQQGRLDAAEESLRRSLAQYAALQFEDGESRLIEARIALARAEVAAAASAAVSARDDLRAQYGEASWQVAAAEQIQALALAGAAHGRGDAAQLARLRERLRWDAMLDASKPSSSETARGPARAAAILAPHEFPAESAPRIRSAAR